MPAAPAVPAFRRAECGDSPNAAPGIRRVHRNRRNRRNRRYNSPTMLSLLFAASLAAAQVPDSAHVVVIATTDVHGRATSWDYVADRASTGGLTRVATIVDSLRKRYPGQVVTLDAGDLLQGNPFAAYAARPGRRGPNPVIEAMNLAGYDAATPGNHDFDWGVPELERALADAAFPYVSANIYALPADSLLVSPFRVLRRGGVRVGVTGFTTPGVMVWDRDLLRGRIRVGRIERNARATIESMRRTSDLVVVLAHSGLAGASTYDTAGVGAENVAAIFAALPVRPDLVIVGHSHAEIRDSSINGVRLRAAETRGGFGRRGPCGPRAARSRPLDASRASGRELVATEDAAPSALLEQRLAPGPRRGARLGGHAARRGARADAGDGGAGRPDAAPRLDARSAKAPRRRAARRRSRVRPRGGLSDTIRRRDLRRLYPYENTLRAVRITGDAAPAVPRAERPLLQGRSRPAGSRSNDDDARLRLRSRARRALRHRPPAAGREPDPEPRGRRPRGGSRDSFTLAVNSHRQTGAGGYAMLAGRAGGLRRGRAIQELLEEELRARAARPVGIAPSEWRIVPEVSAVAVREIYGIAPDRWPRSASDTVVLRLLGTAGLHGRLAPRRPASRARWTASAPAATVPRSGSTAAARATRPHAALAGCWAALGFAARGAGASATSTGPPIRCAAGSRSRGIRGWPPTCWTAPPAAGPAGWRRTACSTRPVSASRCWATLRPRPSCSQPAERTRGLRFGAGELGLHDALGEVRQAKPSTHRAARARRRGDELVRLARGAARQRGEPHHRRRRRDRVETRHRRDAGGGAAAGPASLAVADLVKTPAGGLDAPDPSRRTVSDSAVAPARPPLAACARHLRPAARQPRPPRRWPSSSARSPRRRAARARRRRGGGAPQPRARRPRPGAQRVASAPICRPARSPSPAPRGRARGRRPGAADAHRRAAPSAGWSRRSRRRRTRGPPRGRPSCATTRGAAAGRRVKDDHADRAAASCGPRRATPWPPTSDRGGRGRSHHAAGTAGRAASGCSTSRPSPPTSGASPSRSRSRPPPRSSPPDAESPMRVFVNAVALDRGEGRRRARGRRRRTTRRWRGRLAAGLRLRHRRARDRAAAATRRWRRARSCGWS